MNDDRMDEFIDEFLERFKKATGFDFKTGKLSASTEPDLPPNSTEPPPLWILRPWINVSPPPQKIQGYTAEQWQEIIDGGYLCEFSDRGGIWWPGQLGEIPTQREAYMTCPGNKDSSGAFYNCRPAQLKGVMRPIWAEPVDNKGEFMFFDDCNRYKGSSNSALRGAISWSEIMEDLPEGCATKYIEV